MPTSVAPITFFVREDADWWIGGRTEARPRQLPADGGRNGDGRAKARPLRVPEDGGQGEPTNVRLSPPARDVWQMLQRAGASFFPDIVRGTRRLKAEVETALWELVAAGLVTADGFDNLRALIDPRRRAGHGTGRHARPRHSAGRWSLLHPLPIDDRARQLESVAWMLLRRYGVVFRELVANETVLPAWRDVLIALRRLEDRGEIRGGRFVSGFVGEQFAVPAAVESLRAQRHHPPSGELVTVAASDPLNLTGIFLAGDRIPATPGRFVTFKDGIPLGASETARTA
jgi:ATP-dependent Lhr-like helicase